MSMCFHKSLVRFSHLIQLKDSTTKRMNTFNSFTLATNTGIYLITSSKHS